MDHIVNAGYRLVASGAMTGTSTTTSPVYISNRNIYVGVCLIWTGTPNGSFTISISPNYNASTGSGTFIPLTLVPTITATGAAGTYAQALMPFPWTYLQVAYTNTSGTGSFDVYISEKGI